MSECDRLCCTTRAVKDLNYVSLWPLGAFVSNAWKSIGRECPCCGGWITERIIRDRYRACRCVPFVLHIHRAARIWGRPRVFRREAALVTSADVSPGCGCLKDPSNWEQCDRCR
jgi:hypothetical protein